MKKFTFPVLVSLILLSLAVPSFSQVKIVNGTKDQPQKRQKEARTVVPRCQTMEAMEEAIRNNPSLVEQWRKEGEKQYQLYLDRISSQRGQETQATIVIPVVFHLVDVDTTLAGITDRDILEQIEILNRDYAGKKLDEYTSVIPPEVAARVGRMDLKFVLARRTPAGALTTGIERRVNTTPSYPDIKSFAQGGLDAWDVTKYLNVWCGTIPGLLGIATFPFTTNGGAQGVTIEIRTLPFASPVARGYFAQYAEGSSLSHEVGHYFYLLHTFGDQASCNNNDFGIQSGWPLPTGAGPEGDDTPMEKGTGNSSFVYGNPSMNYNDGCAAEPFGIIYGSYMNYFDDRALFMFTNGQKNRVIGCINAYRASLLTTDGATPPSAVTDAFLVNVSPRGLPERRSIVVNNTPFKATVRNSGTTTLTSVTVNVKIDAAAATPTVFPLSLAPGRDTLLTLANISGAAGSHTYLVYTTAPNGGTDDFLNSDTLYSFYYIHAGTATLPLTENFTSATFPPTNWVSFNPNGAQTTSMPNYPASWERSATSGFTTAGSAFFDNYNVNMNGNFGTLDDLISPAIDLGTNTAAALTFKVAHAVYDVTDVSGWDGLEVYVSGDGGRTYNLAWKKTGNQLKTITAAQTSAFGATPAQPDRWREEQVNLTPYIVPGQRMIIKFRNTNAYGNNLYVDDISVVPVIVGVYDAQISAIINPANGGTVACLPTTAVVTIRNAGVTTTLTAATINVQLNGTVVGTQAWTGSLAPGASENVTLTSVPLTPVLGSNTLKVYTTLPTGLTDANTANDTSTAVFTFIAPSTMPVTNTFETGLLPTGWSLVNPDADFTWTLSTPGAGGSSSSASINNFDNDARGHIDDIRTPVINTSTGLSANDSVLITFDLAHKNFPDPSLSDTLKILVSTNCGNTFTTVWAKGGADLATAGPSSPLPPGYVSPAISDWKNQRISLGSNILGAGQVIVAFRNVNGFGNYIWLDNINVIRKPRVDLQASAIVRPASTECAPPFAPSVTVKNNGEVLITGFKVGYILNGGTPVVQAVNTSLAPGASTTVTLPNVTPPAGNNTIKLFVADPISASPGPDFTIANDTLTRIFFVPLTVTNVVEGFEGGTFPPANWFRINPDNAITWERTSPGKESNFSIFVDNYDYATNAYLFDYMQTPPVNTAGADSLIITFDYANQYWTDGVDTSVDNLSVLVSRNCATSFSTVYSVTGSDLSTAGGGQDPYLDPAPSDWKKVRIVVNLVASPANNVITQFRNGDAYGNNTFIDNINIVPQFKRDIEILSISPDVACTTGFTPVATIRNRGTEAVTGYKISYIIGAGAPVTTTVVTGVNIAPNATATVTLNAGTLAAGANTIRVFTFEPTTASGTGDQYVVNDTMTKISYATPAPVSAPLVETFEGSFVPAGWAISNPDNALTWQKAGVGKGSAGSAYMRNFIYLTANGARDQLFTPVVNFTGVDSVQLSFDLSAATKASPSAAVPMDTLEVLVTKDCGNTFTSVYKKWGTQLVTVLDPVSPLPSEFVPFADYFWRTETIDLTSFRPNGPLQVVFRNSSNGQNNIFIDNVNLNTKVLPARLKSDGVIISPSPFADQFNIWYVQAPADLRYVTIYNSAGQLIWKKDFSSGSTSNVIPVDLTGKAAGIYVLYLGYSDKSKDKQIRIMKAN